MPDPTRQTESLTERAKRLDREIARAGGLAAYWCSSAPAEYARLVDPVTGNVLAARHFCPLGYGECEDAGGCVYPYRCPAHVAKAEGRDDG